VINISYFLEINWLKFYNHCSPTLTLNTNVGSVDIATSEVSGRQMTDRWFTLTTSASPTARKDNRAVPTSPAVVRVKANFQSINILPVRFYRPLTEVRGLYSVWSDFLLQQPLTAWIKVAAIESSFKQVVSQYLATAYDYCAYFMCNWLIVYFIIFSVALW